jgi:hypothetical protein
MDALDATAGGDNNDIDDDDIDHGTEDDWDDEFEASILGLSDDELIDELIENTPSLTQLEMEIISQEIDGRSSADRDALDDGDDFDLSDNPAYQDIGGLHSTEEDDDGADWQVEWKTTNDRICYCHQRHDEFRDEVEPCDVPSRLDGLRFEGCLSEGFLRGR